MGVTACSHRTTCIMPFVVLHQCLSPPPPRLVLHKSSGFSLRQCVSFLTQIYIVFHSHSSLKLCAFQQLQSSSSWGVAVTFLGRQPPQ